MKTAAVIFSCRPIKSSGNFRIYWCRNPSIIVAYHWHTRHIYRLAWIIRRHISWSRDLKLLIPVWTMNELNCVGEHSSCVQDDSIIQQRLFLIFHNVIVSFESSHRNAGCYCFKSFRRPRVEQATFSAFQRERFRRMWLF